MANLKKRLPENVAGEFFVDSTCIDCDTCRQLAPEAFAAGREYSFVHNQPQSPEQVRRALHALLACPTGSIGTLHHNNASAIKADFPLRIEGEVYYCGFNSAKSFGGNSYFVRHPYGNWLIDSPKYLGYLVEKFEEMGGVRWLFLTHRDDVADAARYAERFGGRRIIHRAELDAQPDAEIILDGEDPVEVAPGFVAIPTPGHTEGHCVLLYENRFLFTGDHLDWDRDAERLYASRDHCWCSWAEQTKSMNRLAGYTFEWVLPGHGQRVQLSPEIMRLELQALVQRMRTQD